MTYISSTIIIFLASLNTLTTPARKLTREERQGGGARSTDGDSTNLAEALQAADTMIFYIYRDESTRILFNRTEVPVNAIGRKRRGGARAIGRSVGKAWLENGSKISLRTIMETLNEFIVALSGLCFGIAKILKEIRLLKKSGNVDLKE